MSIVVLNASREVLGVTSLRRAVTMLAAGSAFGIALAHSDNRIVTASSGATFEVPPLIALAEYVHVPFRRPSPTRRNIFARDHHTCQFGSCDGRADTLDHLLPRSRGGGNTWANLVASCATCNGRKGNRTPSEWGRGLKQQPRPLTWALAVVLRERLPVAQVAQVAAM